MDSMSPGHMLPPIGQKSPARYGNIGKTNGNANMIAELRKYQHGIRRSASAPVHLDDDDETSTLSDFRTSGFSVATQGTAATSAAMSRQHSKDGSGASISDMKIKARNVGETSPSPRGLATLSEDAVLGDKSDTPTSPPPPPPPIPPPMPDYLRGRDDSPPPPPPPPPPPGITFSADSGAAPSAPPMPAFLAGISAGVKLRRAGSTSKKELMPPPPPIMRRSSKRYSKTPQAAPDRRKEVAFTASKKMKTLQWEKVQQGKLDKTLWARAEEEQAQEEVAEKLKMVDVWSEMEDEFKAREAAMDAVCECSRDFRGRSSSPTS